MKWYAIMYTLYILFHYYFTYYTYYLSYYFSYYFTAYYYFMYYFTIIFYYTFYFYYYFWLHQGFASLFPGAGDANSRPIRQTMTDKFPGAPTKLWDDQASSHYEAKPTYSAEKRILYALFLVLFLLFWL